MVLPLKPVTPKGAPAVTPVIVITVLPSFDTVTVWAGLVVFTSWFPKPNDVGDTFKIGVGNTPVPESRTKVGEPLALLAIEMVPVTVPAVVGLNRTESVKLCEGVSVTGELQPVML